MGVSEGRYRTNSDRVIQQPTKLHIKESPAAINKPRQTAVPDP
jgi:hypothetical protein